MTYGVQLPDGRTIGFDESTPLDVAQQIVRRDFPDAFQKKSGVGAEFKEGLASLIGGTKTALTAPFDAKEAAKKGLLEEQARGAEFESGVSLDKLKKAYQDYGFLGAAGEVTSQLPQALAGMSPQVAATLGATATGARLGAMAGLPGIIGGGAAGFASSFLPQAGQNITRQAQEQEAAGQEINPSLTKAYGAAAGQAALETASLGFGLGKRLVSKVLGESEEQIAKGLATNAAKYEADLVKAAEAKLLPTVAKGAARGLVEIPTEVAQQILERAQAGLDLFSPDAISEYGSAAYQATLGGPAFAGLASPIERSQARGELEGLRGEQRAVKQRELRAQEEAYKASPEYIQELTGRREKLQEEIDTLKPIVGKKVDTPEEKEVKREAQARMRDLRIEMQDVVGELRAVAPEEKGLPLTLEQRMAEERAKRQATEIAKTSDLVTDEFGNIVPGLTKSGAVQGRELSPQEKAKADRAMKDLGRLKEAEAKRQLNAQEKAKKAELEAFIAKSNEDIAAQAASAPTITKPVAEQEYEDAVKELQDAIAASGQVTTTEKDGIVGKAYTAPEESRDVIQALQEKVKDKDAARKAAAGEVLDESEINRYAQSLQDIAENEADRAEEVNAQKLVDLFTEPEKPAQTELTPEQKAAETKRNEKLQFYKKNFFDAAANYQRLVAEAEERAKTPRTEGERGTELYAETKPGRSLEVLSKGKELQAALEAQTKAKGELITFLNRPSGNVVTPAEAAETLKDVALLDLTDTVDTMRKGQWFGGPNPKMAGAPLKVLANRARKQLDRYVTNVINQVESVRHAKGLPKLSEKSRKEIADKITKLFAGKIERATGKLAKKLKAGEKFEGDTAVRRALEAAGFKFTGIPSEGEIKTGFSREEFQDVKDFVQGIQDTYSEKQREFGKLTPESTGDLFGEGRIKDTGKARKTEIEADEVTKTARLLDKVYNTDLTPDQRTVFERAERMLGEGLRTKDVESETATGVTKVMPGLVDSVNEQANRVLKGLEPDLKDIKAAIARVEEAFVAPVQVLPSGKEVSQLELFPGQTATIRATRQNFVNLMAVERRKGSAVINAARKWLNGFKVVPPYAEDARSLFKVVSDLERQVAKLKREQAQLDPKKVTDYAKAFKEFDRQINEVQAKIPKAQKDFEYHSSRAQAYVAGQFAKLFDNKNVWGLLDDATKLDAEGAKFLRKGKNKYRNEANQAFDLAEEYRKEAYSIYAEAEKSILKQVEKIDAPNELLTKVEALKKKVEKEVKETVAKQKAEVKELSLPEYPERIKLLRLQGSMLDKTIKSTKERVAEEQAVASRQTGLGLPGVKSEIPVQEKLTADLPHRYDAVQTKFNFARQYYKEIGQYRDAMLARRSITMNKAQTKAYQEASQNLKDAELKYKESRDKLNKAFKENNVDKNIAAIMNSMVEMDNSTREYRSLENRILGIEEQLQQKVLGVRPKAVTKLINQPQLAPNEELDKELGYEAKPTPAEAFVGRISETDLAAFRKDENTALEKAKARLYGLSLQGEEKRAASEKERTKLAAEVKRLEASIKATDIILNARRIGLAVGKAQEEMGAKRYKPTETEKKMVKEGKFEKAGVAPEYYRTVAQSFREREKAAESALERRTPEYARSLAKRIVALDERIVELSADQVGEKKRLTDEVAFLKREFSAAMSRQKAETLATAFQQVMDTNFRYTEGKSGGIDPAVAESFINSLSTKFGGKVGDKTIKINDNVKFIYAKSIADAPDAVINAAVATNKDPFKVRGAVLPDGTVVVIGAAHTDIADLQETVAHELLGHYAVDSVLGVDGMKALVKKVFAGGEEGVLKLATELGVYNDVTEAFLAAKNSGLPKEEMQMLVTREMVAHVAQKPLPSKASQAIKDFVKMVINAVRNFFKGNGFDKLSGASTQEIYKLIREATKQYEAGKIGAYTTPDGSVAFFAPTSYSGSVDQDSIDTLNKLYGKKKTLKDKLLGNLTGLAATTQFLDRLAPAEQLLKKGASAGLIDATKALETTMYLRQTDQRLNMTAQAATHGVPELVMNEAGEMEVLGKKDGANLIKVSNILQKAKMLGDAQAINDLFGAYLVDRRVERVGMKALSADLAVTRPELKAIVANIEKAGALDIFKEAAQEYAQYNKDLINFAVQTGAISRELGARLTRYNDYVPFYRVREGIAELVIAGEHPIIIGRLTDQPYLHELIGGKEMIMNFEESAFQNTGVLIDLALRNLATSRLAQQFEKIGTPQTKVATRVSPKVKGTDIIRAKINGVDAAWKLNTKDTGFEDIPADLLIKGLDGIKTQLPVAIKLLGLPSRWLRTMITRDPAYSVRQIVKDSTAMWMYSGADAKPVVDATKELGKMWAGKSEGEAELQRAGLLGGQLFTGMPEDMRRSMLQITSGKTGWQSTLAKLDRLAIQGDAATRVAMYNSYIKQGMSPMRAKLATLEALNVNKRGLSPTIYMLSTLVPFMSTQIQGLSVFAKAMTGNLDLAGQKDLGAKLFRRGMTVALLTMLYAASMQDDEAYKNADPFTKYNSWFVRVPGLDEPLKVPTPFEFGYVFKGLSEALYNLMFTDEKSKNVLKFFGQAALNSIPIGLPQAIKPAIEATANFSFFTGENIESAKEKGMLPGFRERNQTTELAKWVSSLDKEHLSPVMLDYLARSYGGGLTIALASLMNPVLAPTSDVAAPTKSPSQYPVIGSFFQPNDSSGLINAAYETANRAQQATKSFDAVVAKGNKAEIEAFARKYSNELMLESLTGSFTREMGEIAAAERVVRADKNMSGDEKAEKIKQLRAIRIKLAEVVNKATPS